jgi:hypothetical protein
MVFQIEYNISETNGYIYSLRFKGEKLIARFGRLQGANLKGWAAIFMVKVLKPSNPKWKVSSSVSRALFILLYDRCSHLHN